MQEAKKETKRRNTSNTYSIDVMFYKLKLEKADATKTAFKDAKRQTFNLFLERTQNRKCKSNKIYTGIGRKTNF